MKFGAQYRIQHEMIEYPVRETPGYRRQKLEDFQSGDMRRLKCAPNAGGSHMANYQRNPELFLGHPGTRDILLTRQNKRLVGSHQFSDLRIGAFDSSREYFEY